MKTSVKRSQRRKQEGEKIRAYFRAYVQIKKSDPQWRIARSLRTRAYTVMKGVKKSAPMLRLMGGSFEEVRARLESQFRASMTWENYGVVWHIDHIRPCASFDLTQPDQQRECFHFSNLQPLFAAENLRKAAKLGLTFP